LLRSLAGAIGRAAIVLFGTTITAWYLIDRIDSRIGRPVASEGDRPNRWSEYWSSFGDALGPSAEVSEALGRTLLLAAAGIAIGLVVGALVGLLMRIGPLRRVVGFLTLPAMALAIPGVALYPLARAATSRGWAESGPVDLETSLGDGLAYISLWGLLVGLAIAPSVAAEFGRTSTGPTIGPNVARNWSLVRAQPGLGSRFGLPTTALICGLAVAEVLSGYGGAFASLFDALSGRRLDEVFQLVFWLSVAGAALMLAVHLAARVGAEDLRDGPAGLVTPPTAGAVPSPRSLFVPPTVVNRPLLMAMTLLLTLTVGVAVAGWLADPTGRDAGAVLLRPTAGGPWLGTDQVGRGLGHLSAVGLWPAIAASATPALVATTVGLLLVGIGSITPPAVSRTINTLIDVLWWPTPAILPLAFLAFGSGGRSGLTLGLLVATGLALTPLAYRVASRTVAAGSGRLIAQAGSVLVFCAGVALSIHVLLGFVGFGGSNERPHLGMMIRTGLDTYDASVWPYLVPVGAVCILAWILYTMAAALAVPVAAPALVAAPKVAAEARVTIPMDEPVSVSPDPVAPPAPPEVRADSGAEVPLVAAAADTEPTVEIEDGAEFKPTTEFVAADQPQPSPEVPATPESSPTTEFNPGTPAETDAQDLTADQVSVEDIAPADSDPVGSDPVDTDPADDDPADRESAESDSSDDVAEEDHGVIDLDDLPTVLEEATRTVELRPSQLREAGIGAPSARTEPTPLTTGWSKPDLAARPSPSNDGEPEPDQPQQ
jgi:ABC-type dipeptide/oligopeptide/nickel transport system permease subunit